MQTIDALFSFYSSKLYIRIGKANHSFPEHSNWVLCSCLLSPCLLCVILDFNSLVIYIILDKPGDKSRCVVFLLSSVCIIYMSDPCTVVGYEYPAT